MSDTPIPLSLNHEFVTVFDQGDEQGPFGPRYHIVHGWRIHGTVDVGTLQAALDDVVERHESLRTTIVRGEDKHQVVNPPSPVSLEVRDLAGVPAGERDAAVEELLIEVEASEKNVRDLPHIRAVLARFDAGDSVLVILSHHTSTDGFSMRVIIRDVAARYATRRGFEGHELPAAQQYQEFARWQRSAFVDPALAGSRQYWREKLDGGQTFAMPTDRPRSAGGEPTTAMYRFTIGKEVVKPALKLARTMRSSPFIIMVAAFTVAVHRMTGSDDVAVPTFSPGRPGDMFQDTVGSFFNFLPLRTDLSGAQTYREAASRVRATCIEGYAHDVPMILAEAPAFMAPAVADNLAPAVFQVFPFPYLMDGTLVGDLEYTEVRWRLRNQPLASDIPDGALWTLNIDASGDIIGCVAYKSALFDESTIARWVAALRGSLESLVATPDASFRPSAAAA